MRAGRGWLAPRARGCRRSPPPGAPFWDMRSRGPRASVLWDVVGVCDNRTTSESSFCGVSSCAHKATWLHRTLSRTVPASHRPSECVRFWVHSTF